MQGGFRAYCEQDDSCDMCVYHIYDTDYEDCEHPEHDDEQPDFLPMGSLTVCDRFKRMDAIDYYRRLYRIHNHANIPEPWASMLMKEGK